MGQNIKNIDKTNLIWCVNLIRKQEIIVFFYHMAKCPTKAKKIEMQKWVNYYWLQGWNENQTQKNFHSYTIMANIWGNIRK